MSRQEFSKPVKREALKRSGGLCEAVGTLYGLREGVRCNLLLSYGVHFDHINPDSNGGKPTLDNCLATCPKCNLYKAHKFDTPRASKGLRQRDKSNGIRTKRPGNPMPGSKASPWKHSFSDGWVKRNG